VAGDHRIAAGPGRVHEIKHDGYRLQVRREGDVLRLFTRNGYDWSARFTGLADASLVVLSWVGSAAGVATVAVCAGSSIAVSESPVTTITAVSLTSALIASTDRIAGSAAASSTVGSKASATVVSVVGGRRGDRNSDRAAAHAVLSVAVEHRDDLAGIADGVEGQNLDGSRVIRVGVGKRAAKGERRLRSGPGLSPRHASSSLLFTPRYFHSTLDGQEVAVETTGPTSRRHSLWGGLRKCCDARAAASEMLP
jgi:hypothetical protein